VAAENEALSRRARRPSAARRTASPPRWRSPPKHRIGKMGHAALLARDFEAIIATQGFDQLPITVHHARLAGEMNIA